MTNPGAGRLHAVVVTYRRPKELALVLDALERQTLRPDTITIVDNDDDPKARTPASVRTGTSYIATGDNVGPAGGLAAGVAALTDSGADNDWVVFVDDDDPPPGDDTLEVLTRFRRQLEDCGQRVGAVGCNGARFDRRMGQLQRVPDVDLVGPVPVDFIGGGSFPIYSLKALRVAGGPRTDLFFGFDDLELGLRLADHGFPLFAHGEFWRELRTAQGRLGMTPRQAAQIRPRTAWRRYYAVRNLLWIAHQYGGALATLIATFRVGLAAAAADIVRQRSPAAAVPALHGVFDALRGRLGRRVDPG